MINLPESNSLTEREDLIDDDHQNIAVGIRESKHNDDETKITQEDLENLKYGHTPKDKVRSEICIANEIKKELGKDENENVKDKVASSKTVWVQFIFSKPEIPPELQHTQVEHVPYDPKQRNGFVRLVFTILFIMLVVTITAIILIMMTPEAKKFYKGFGRLHTIGISLLLVIVNMVMIFVGHARVPPWNILCLIVTVILMTNLAAIISVRYDTEVLIIAFATTSVVVLLCLGLACTNFDFTKWYLYMVAISCVFCVVSLLIAVTMLAMKWRYTPLRIALLFIGSIINVIMLIIELQMVLGGKSVQLSETDYALAAYLLYSSIVHLFLKILSLFGILNE